MKAVRNIIIVLFFASSTMLCASEYQLFTTTKTTFRSVSPVFGNKISSVTGVSRNGAMSSHGVLASTTPVSHFKSTSTIYDSGSTLPCAAETGVYTTVGDEAPRSGSGPRRVGGWDDNNAGDPGAVPLGDAVLPLLLLAAGYGVFIARKRRDCAERN